MKIRSGLFFGLLLLRAGVAQSVPIAGAAPITGVVMQSYEPQNGMWVAHLVNMSHKYVVSVDIGVSIVPKGAFGEYTVNYGKDSFAPGATKDVNLGRVTEGKTISPVVDVVVYADDTAEVTNDRAFNNIIRDWKESILTMQKENEILLKYASSANRAEDTARDLEQLAATIGNERNDESLRVRPLALRSLAQELRNGRIDPEAAIKLNSQLIADFQPHTQITKITGGAL